MRMVCAAVIASMVSGCGVVARQQHQEAVEQAQIASAEIARVCDEKFPAAGKRYVERTRCQNSSLTPFRKFVPYPDLFDQEMASRMAFAERLQAGTITLAEANLAQSQAHSQIVAEEQRRSLSGRAVSAQESAAAAAWRASAPVSCTRVGNTTSCY